METGHRLTDNLEIHFLEVPKWQVKSMKEMKRLDRWLGYLSKKLNDEEREVLAMAEKSIRDAMKMRTVKTEKITFSKGGSYLSWLVIQTILLFDKGGKGDGGES